MDMGGGSMNHNSIPSEEDFARAKAAMRSNDRGLSEVRDDILSRYKAKGLHEFLILYSPSTCTFGAYVFYRWARQIKELEEAGLSAEIRESVLNALTAVGRGNRDLLRVDFEFDSHENIEQNYEGDYYARLR